MKGDDVYLLSLVDILVSFAKVDENLLAASNLLRVADAVDTAELLVVEHGQGITASSESVRRLDAILNGA